MMEDAAERMAEVEEFTAAIERFLKGIGHLG